MKVASGYLPVPPQEASALIGLGFATRSSVVVEEHEEADCAVEPSRNQIDSGFTPVAECTIDGSLDDISSYGDAGEPLIEMIGF